GLDERVLGQYHFSGLAAMMARNYAPASTAAAQGPGSRIAGPKTVLVDFTASWCPTCHVFESTVLNADPVIESLRRLGVVTVKADWSDDSPEVTEMLDVLGSRQIPVIAIFSAHDPNHPSVFRGGYTQEEILHALEKAGPSPGAGV
ncbi:MAG: thioredoxin family protein, partial [Thermoguttaceae bacterium]